MKIHYLQHAPFEGLGGIEAWAKRRGHALSCTRLFAAEPLPGLNAFDQLIVMGGPMNIYEENKFPWLAQEKRLLEAAMKKKKSVLGICLGAQLLADVLGAKVYRNRDKEIGWHKLRWTPAAQQSPLFDFVPDSTPALHWHGDTFPLPAGATRLATSEACENQGFIYNDTIVALQFHWEITPAGLAELGAHCAIDITNGPYVQPLPAMLADNVLFEQCRELMEKFLNRFEKLSIQEVEPPPPYAA